MVWQGGGARPCGGGIPALACLYEKGLGVGQDMRQAKNLYQRVAEKGNTRAMHNLGVLVVEGSDSKPKYTSAALWFGKAAEYGIRDSQYNLAVLLAREPWSAKRPCQVLYLVCNRRGGG